MKRTSAFIIASPPWHWLSSLCWCCRCWWTKEKIIDLAAAMLRADQRHLVISGDIDLPGCSPGPAYPWRMLSLTMPGVNRQQPCRCALPQLELAMPGPCCRAGKSPSRRPELAGLEYQVAATAP